MTVPKRKANAPVEATQELQALDVLELVETLKKAPAPTAEAAANPGPAPVVIRKSLTSNSSIAPVGLDLAPHRAAADEEVNPTMEIRLPTRRRRLGGIVIGAIAGCALILVAAGIARVGHASSAPDTASSPATTTAAAAATATPPDTTPPDTTPPDTTPAATSTATTAAPATTAAAPDPSSGTGTVRLDRPAVPGHVWLDGKKLQAKSALVSCGTHLIKVGRGRSHSIDVPCGSEIAVSK
jgi:hypothetical protein